MSQTRPHPYLSAASRPELPQLTGLRAIAALWVVSWHSSGPLPGPPFPISHGYLGVDLFFILSGFIISYVYWQDFERPERRLYLRFIGLRVARLWPAHMTIVAVVLLIEAVSVALSADKAFPAARVAEELPLHLLLIHNWGFVFDTKLNFPSWSVSAEFFAYVLFPLYVVLFRRLRTTAGLLAAIVLAMVLCWLGMTVILEVPLGTSGRIGQIRVVCEFAIGVALFRLWQSQALAHLPWTAISCLALAGIAAITWFAPFYHPLDYLLVLLMAPLLLGLVHGGTMLAHALAMRPLVYLGEISYSVYLVHGVAIQLVGSVLRRIDGTPAMLPHWGWQFWGLAMTGSLVGGALLFHAVEKPARYWLRARIDSKLPASG